MRPNYYCCFHQHQVVVKLTVAIVYLKPNLDRKYINYKKFRRDKISNKCFYENFLDESSNETKFCHNEIIAFKNFDNSRWKP